MKKFKKIVAAAVAVAVLTTAGIAFAAELITPAEIISELTGKPLENLYEERNSGKTYGTIANENDVLADFKSQMLEQKKAILDQKVLDGALTQEKAEEIYKTLEENIANCDGSGCVGIGKNNIAGFGKRADASYNKNAREYFGKDTETGQGHRMRGLKNLSNMGAGWRNNS